MKWKLVPVEPTPEMIDAWNNDDQHRAIAMILQGKTAIYEGGQCTP